MANPPPAEESGAMAGREVSVLVPPTASRPTVAAPAEPAAAPIRPRLVPARRARAALRHAALAPWLPIVILRFGWLILLALAPVVIVITPARAPVLLVVPALLALQARASRGAHRSPLSWPLLLLAVMVLVSLWATFSVEWSLAKVAGMVLGLGLYYAVIAAGRGSERRVAWLFAAYLALGGAFSAVGLLGTTGAYRGIALPAPVGELRNRLVTLPGAMIGSMPNEVAGVLLWVAPLALALSPALWRSLPPLRRAPVETPQDSETTGSLVLSSLSSASSLSSQAPQTPATPVLSSRKVQAVAALLVTLLALGSTGVVVLTRSRSGWAGLAAAVVAMGVIAATTASRRQTAEQRSLVGHRRPAVLSPAVLSRGALLLLLAIVAAAALIYRAELQAWLSPAVLAGTPLLKSSDPARSLDARLEIWSRALYGIQDFAFTGMGLNNFRRVVHLLYPLFLIAPDADIAHAHNLWLQVALDLGLPGLIAYVALWLGTIAMLFQALRRTRPYPRTPRCTQRHTHPDAVLTRAAAIGLLGSFAGQFAYGLFDTVALGARPGFLWWMLLALATLLWLNTHGPFAAGSDTLSPPPTSK